MFPDKLTLRTMQEYVAEVEQLRGFAKQTAVEKCLLLGEEVGELFKAVRKASGMPVDRSSDRYDVAEELADVLNFLLAIANRFDVDLEQAYRLKEEQNNKRTWDSR